MENSARPNTSPTGNARLLISHITLRGPEIEQLYKAIYSQPGIAYSDLVRTSLVVNGEGSDQILGESPLREALSFLVISGLVRQEGTVRRKSSFYPAPQFDSTNVSLLLLHHLHSHSDERQRAIILVHRQVVFEERLSCTVLSLREQMERGPYGGLFAWTEQKMLLWVHLADYLGLARPLQRSSEILIVPKLQLVQSALQWAAGSEHRGHSLNGLLRQIDANLFTCFTRQDRIHEGLAQALIALDQLGSIHLTHSADAANSLLLGDWRVSDISFAV